MNLITTERLRLVPATAHLVQLEIENLPAFFETLGVRQIPDWPSNSLAHVLPLILEQLTCDPSLEGWLAWYWILDTTEDSHLVGGGGFKGTPKQGIVEIGYETRFAFQRMGIATEAVGAQVAWALNHSEIDCVMAETHKHNAGSIGVLRSLRFVEVSLGSKGDLIRFERSERIL